MVHRATSPKRLGTRFFLGALLLAGATGVPETFERADVDQQGRLRIVTSTGRVIVPVAKKDQVGFDRPSISADRRAVGWLALFPNCCTSYPIALSVGVYTNGRQRTFTGNDLAVARWSFTVDGKQLAFRQETVHGGNGVHYELRDVSTGRRLAIYDPDPEKPANPPGWVRTLDAAP